MRLLCLSVLLLLPAAQAFGDDPVAEVEGQIEQLVGTVDPSPSSATGSQPVDDLQGAAGQEAGQAQQAAQERQERAERAAKRLEAQVHSEVDKVALQAEDSLRPGHQLVGDAQEELDDLLTEPESAPEQEPAAPASTAATVVDAWPEYAQPVMIFGGAVAGFGVLAWLLGQSATVGAGAAGTAAARDGRRFLPFASPLFTRFERDTVLGHPKREAIYGQIIGKPGITLQDLCEESGLSRTAVTHHLRLLEQQHLVVSKRMGRSRHFFENGGRYGRNQKDAYAVLHNDRSKEIHAFIADHPGAIQKDLCGAFGIQASVAHWHVKRLLEANLVEAVRQGRTVSYFPAGQAAYA